MSFRNTLVLAAVLCFLGLFIFKYEIPEGERVARESFVLHTMAEKQIDRIAVSGEKGEFVLLRSEGAKTEAGDQNLSISGWSLQGLPEAALESASVVTLASALQGFKSDSAIPEKETASDLSLYGLDKPLLSIEVGAADKKTTMKFGKKNEFLDKRYVQVKGEQGTAAIVLADDTVFNAASKSREDFRDKNPIQFSDSAPKTITGEWKGAHIVLEQDETTWRLKEPAEAAADQSTVLDFIRELRGLKVAEFIDNVTDPSPYHLEMPEAVIQITFKDAAKKPLSIDLSTNTRDKGQSLYFSLGGSTVFKSAGNPLPNMLKHPNQFRARQLFNFDVEKVRKVVVTRKGAAADEQTVLQSAGTGWKVNGNDGDAVFVLQYLNDIALLEASDFPGKDQKDFGFENPSLRIEVTLVGADGKESAKELLIGKSAAMPGGGKGYFAADKEHKEVPFMISEALMQKLTPNLEGLKVTAATPAPLVTAK